MAGTQRIVCDERLRHIAVIMDGNGRWAKKRGMPRSFGHRAGAAAFRKIVDYCEEIDLKCLTVYAFSCENWARPEEERKEIFKLLSEYLDTALDSVAKKNMKVVFLGDKSPLPEELQKKMEHLESVSFKNERVLNVAVNYGGRQEILHAVKQICKQGVDADSLCESDIEKHLYTASSPAPDLIIRTAGEQRLSNFLLWQSAYSEYYFTEVLWPDFSPKELDLAISDFYGRKRNFGKLPSAQ